MQPRNYIPTNKQKPTNNENWPPQNLVCSQYKEFGTLINIFLLKLFLKLFI